MNVSSSWPAVRGGLLALGAAVLFGASAPLVQRWGAGAGSLATAACLYGGAAAAGAALRSRVTREARVRPADVPRLLWMAAFGAALGPVLLAWGLQRTSAISASLMLTLEAAFTALLARLWYSEAIGLRVGTGLAALTLGGMALAIDGERSGPVALLGLLAVLAATLAWGVDNALSRPLSARDPGQVVMLKALLGASATAVLAAVSGDTWPAPWSLVGLLALGAGGYGLSLRLYLLAQRAFGATRTASVFALAPFIGALLAIAMGERNASPWIWAGSGLMLAGIGLHLSERHAHEHLHLAMEHEHAHRHDDAHHEHSHVPMPDGAHSHWHHHATFAHGHAHAPDEHHLHTH